jgi:hypothetical protein
MLYQTLNQTPDLLVDGYISRTFGPRNAEGYLCGLLGINLTQLTSPAPNGSCFVARPAAGTFPAMPVVFLRGQWHWLIDYPVMDIGTVVSQTLWSSRNTTELRQYATEPSLQLPIFFTPEDARGKLGLSLDDAAKGRCESLRDAKTQALLGEKYTTTIRILVCAR